jgi:hypothetical protein
MDWSKKDFEEDHQMNIPTKFIPISPEVSETCSEMCGRGKTKIPIIPWEIIY